MERYTVIRHLSSTMFFHERLFLMKLPDEQENSEYVMRRGITFYGTKNRNNPKYYIQDRKGASFLTTGFLKNNRFYRILGVTTATGGGGKNRKPPRSVTGEYFEKS